MRLLAIWLKSKKFFKIKFFRYCDEKRTIILAVTPANIDITTSDGLLLARKWDPSGDRLKKCFINFKPFLEL